MRRLVFSYIAPMKFQTLHRFLALFLLAWGAHAPTQAADLHVLSRHSLAGETRWDYLIADPANHRVFITHGNQVDVWDTDHQTRVGTIPDTPGVHGVALAPDLNRGYTSNGKTNTVTIFELSSLKVLGTLPTEKKPDAIVYDAGSQRVFAANGDSGSLTVVDARTAQVTATIAVGGKLEFAAVDGKGHLYVNVEDRNQLVVVDTQQLKVTARHDISASCDAPTGLSIDPATGRLFVGCRNQQMAVVDAASGKVLASVPVGRGCDATAFDPGTQRAYASSGDGTLTVLNTETYAVDQVVKTQPTARTMALDPVRHLVYVVAAEFDAPVAEGVRPKLKPNSFQLLSIGR